MKLSAHGVRLAGSRLSVGEAGGHTALEDVLNERTRGVSEKTNIGTQQKYTTKVNECVYKNIQESSTLHISINILVGNKISSFIDAYKFFYI